MAPTQLYLTNSFDIPELLTDITMPQSLSNTTFAVNASNPDGLRESYWTAGFQLDEVLASDIFEIYVEETNASRT
jgi:hypothetical protein